MEKCVAPGLDKFDLLLEVVLYFVRVLIWKKTELYTELCRFDQKDESARAHTWLPTSQDNPDFRISHQKGFDWSSYGLLRPLDHVHKFLQSSLQGHAHRARVTVSSG